VPETPLPANGEFRSGSVVLSGRRVRAYNGTDEPVAWVSDQLIPDSGRTWRLLSGMAAETGLQPILCVPPGRHPEEWHPDDYFAKPCDIAEIDQLTAEDILTREWEGRAVEDGDLGDASRHWDPAESYAPFSRQFPGLAPPAGEPLTATETSAALDTLPAARVCLVAVRRAADIPSAVGWEVTDAWESMLPVSAVLRSWEDRFGARLVVMGPGAEIRLLVERPVRTLAAARAVAAELWAFCDAMADEGGRFTLTTVSGIAAHVPNAPIWGFWWD
jgi:hypothetical protein